MRRNHLEAIRKASIELAEHKLFKCLSLLAVFVPCSRFLSLEVEAINETFSNGKH